MSLTYSQFTKVDVLQIWGTPHAQCLKDHMSLTYSQFIMVDVLQIWGHPPSSMPGGPRR